MKLFDPTPEYFGHKIRVLIDELNDRAPWFAVVDLCHAIGINDNATVAIRKLDAADVTLYSIQGNRGGRKINFVSESGFYELVLGSRKPGAVAFKRWVCSTVLPSIRRHGEYVAYADDSGNPIDVPVEMVSLALTLPSGTITETAPRIRVGEYCEVKGMDSLGQQQRAALGKIARRLLLTHDLPILHKWQSFRRRDDEKIRKGNVGTYPEAILDLAYQESLNVVAIDSYAARKTVYLSFTQNG